MKRLYTAFLGFGVGSIVMGYVANYNRSQLPIALVCLIILILCELGNKE